MEIMVNPRVDIAFKKIFGVEENKDLLMSLLNAIVSEEDQIDELEILNPYNERNFKNDKLSVLDIKARNKHDLTYFLIEMQLSDETNYHKRGLYGWARVYSNQLSSGQPYEQLRKTIAIHILNFTLIDYNQTKGWKQYSPSKYHHRFVLQDKETGIEFFKDIEIHTIELIKFEGKGFATLEEIMAKVKVALDRWMAFLTRCNMLDVNKLPSEVNIPEIKKALHVAQEMSLNKLEKEMYDAHLDFLRMEAEAFEKKFLDGKIAGIAEGKLQIAKNMLTKGIDTATIAEITGITIEEIKKL